jgi:Phosphotransferase enzyme family
MEPLEVQRAVEAGCSTASALGLRVDDAVVVHSSNRVVVRLTPCDVLARVRPLVHQMADDLEVEVARCLTESGGPVAELAPRVGPRVYVHDGFAVTLWRYYEPVGSSDIGPAEYAQALVRLHAGLLQVEVRAPHFTDRVAEAQRLIADREQTPKLLGPDRELLREILRRLSIVIRGLGTDEQVLHGEPHVGNLLRTREGLLFVDFETCCRGPVEFDIAHGLLPDEDGHMLPAADVCEHYPGANHDLIVQCRLLTWAMITTWRWQRDDHLPNGRYWRIEGLNQIRAALNGPGLDVLGDHT